MNATVRIPLVASDERLAWECEMARRAAKVTPCSAGAPAEAQWYVAQGSPRVAMKRFDFLAEAGASVPPVDLFCPMEIVRVRQGRGRLRNTGRKVELPLFGIYFFVRADLRHEGRESATRAAGVIGALREVDGFGGFLGEDEAGWPRPVRASAFVDELRRQRAVVRPDAPRFRTGDIVRAIAGPLAGHAGRIAARGPSRGVEELVRGIGGLDKRGRVVVLMKLLGADVPVELKTSDLVAG